MYRIATRNRTTLTAIQKTSFIFPFRVLRDVSLWVWSWGRFTFASQTCPHKQKFGLPPFPESQKTNFYLLYNSSSLRKFYNAFYP